MKTTLITLIFLTGLLLGAANQDSVWTQIKSQALAADLAERAQP